MKKKWRKILIFSAYCIGAAALLPNALAVQAADYPDIKNHWAESAVSRWTEFGIINGFDTGKFMPDEPITRGQMATIIDKIMRYQRITENKFSDVDNDYYTEAILKTNAAGVILGYGDDTLRPKNNITQQEAVCMIARALSIPESDTAVTGYETADDWAKPTVYGMAQKKMLDGFTFVPKQPITRAEMLTIVDNALASLFHTANTYEINTQKSVVINTDGVSLRDGTIEGDLIISEGVGDGNITLTNMKIFGSILVQGGGENSIHFDSCTVGNIVIQKQNGNVRVVVENGTKANSIAVNSKAAVEMQNAEVNQVVVNQKDATIDAQKGTALQQLVLNQSAQVKTVDTIQNVTIKEAASDTKITGTGTLTNVTCDAKNVVIDTKYSALAGKETSSAKNSNGQSLPSSSGGSSSGGSGSGGSSSGGSSSGGSSSGGSSSGGSSSGGSSSGDNTGNNTDTNQPENPGDNQPENPGDTNQPENPGDTNQPENPGDTNQPENPGDTNQPENPGDTNQPENPDDNQPLEISTVEVIRYGLLQVTLNQPSEIAFTKDDFSIICTSGGSAMTILDVSTYDNKTYELKTSYFNDQEYELAITLPDGPLITKVFEHRMDCAQITFMDVERINDTTATVQFTVDEPGKFYYLLDTQEPISRAAASDETAAEEEIIKNGVAIEMKKGSNSFTIEALEKDKAYSIRYVTVNLNNKHSLVQTVAIPDVVDENSAIEIENAQLFVDPNGYLGWYGFQIRFNRVITEDLTVNNFEISCPKKDTELSKVTTQDNKTYKIYMQQYTVPYDKVTYTIKVHFSDGTTAHGSCRSDLSVGDDGDDVFVSFHEFTKLDENTILATIKSDGDSMLHYLVQNESDIEGFGTLAPKDPAPIYEKGLSVPIKSGLNHIPFTDAEAGQYFCYAVGSNALYYEYKKIPENLMDASEDEGSVKVVDFEVQQGENSPWYAGGDPVLQLTFNQDVSERYEYEMTRIIELPDVSISENEIDGDAGAGRMFGLQLSKITTIPAGNYTLQFMIDHTYITYPFTVE